MSPKHTSKALSDFATVLGLILGLTLYGIGAQWMFTNAPSVLAWHLIASIPASFIVLAIFKVGSDAD